MSDGSSDEDLAPDWIPYSEREEWADVIPLEQDDGEHPVVVIVYSEKFRNVYNYFRGIIATKEKSLRALELTNDALRLNAANYTVWQYRRDILKELNLDLNAELEFVENFIVDYPKNYQVWHHRRVIVEWINDGSKELSLTGKVLNMDAKNYHAWQHRQWAIKTFNMFDNELSYVDQLISEDIRNNSAWNQRFFVLKHFGFTPEVIDRELHYTMSRIRIVKNNESSWNFLRGLLKEGKGTLDQSEEVVEFAKELYDNGIRSPYLLAFLIDMYGEKCLRPDEENREELAQKVYNLCDIMSKEYDIIRRKYWDYIAGRFRAEIELINKSNNKQTTNDSSV